MIWNHTLSVVPLHASLLMKSCVQTLSAYFEQSVTFYFVIMDMQGKFTYTNPLYREKFSHLLTSTSSPLFFWDECSPQSSRMRLLFQHLSGGRLENTTTEQQVTMADGSPAWIRWELSLVKLADGSGAAIQGVGMDISRDKKNEQQLVQAAGQHRALFHGSHLPQLLIRKEDLTVLDATAEILSFCQYSRQELTQLSLPVLFTRQEWEQVQAQINRHEGIHESWEQECFILPKNNLPVKTRLLFNNCNIGSGHFLQVTMIGNPSREEERQKIILEHVTDLLVTTDEEGFIITWNKVAEEIYEIPATEVMGRHVSQVVKLEYQGISREEALARLYGEGSWEGEVVFTNSKGQRRYLHYSLTRLTGHIYGFSGVLVMGRDITPFRQATLNLEHSEQFYRNLIANSLDGMLIVNENACISFVSPSAKNILGYSPEDLLGQTGFDFIHPDDREFAVNSLEMEVQQLPVIKSIVVRLRHKDGHWLWCMVRGHNMLDNPYINGLIIYFYDDTERKQAREILKESENRFRTLITDLQSGVMLLNPQMEVILCNKAGLELLGHLDETTFIGTSTNDPDWDIIDENNQVLEAEERPSYKALITRRPVSNIVMGIKKFGTPERVWMIVNAAPILDKNNEIMYVVTSFSDITDRKKLEQRLRDEEISKQKLLTQATIDGQEKERKEIGKELHDNIGQQLTTTKLFLEMARGSADGNCLEMINMAIKGISDSINEVRSISRSLVPPTLGDLGLVDSVKELCHSVKKTLAFPIRFYHRDFDENSIPDNQALTLYRIIQEQINNIIKHADARAVILKLSTEEEYTVLDIVDNGCGFELNNRKKGLGIINMINRTELFNGRLEIDTAPGKGCRIRVHIPHMQPELVLN